MKIVLAPSLTSLVMLGFVGGCSREEAARTVPWYREHPEERRTTLARCADDPGHLGQEPNCMNASQAEGLESIGSLRDLPPLGLDPNMKALEPDEDGPSVRP